MTASRPSIPITFGQTQGGIQDEHKAAERRYLAGKRSNNTSLPGAAEWIQPALVNAPTSATNYSHISNNAGRKSSEEHIGEQNYIEMHNNSYLKGGGYSDTRAYYGWMPAGFGPMRFPALIYPHSFLSFAPTVAWMKTNDTPRKVAETEKIDRWEGNRKSGNSSSNSEVSQDSTNFVLDEIENSSDKDTTNCNNSDDDEGLVLDEKETIKRRRQKDVEKLQTQTLKFNQERSSVIQENISIQAKRSVITHDESATTSTHEEQNKPAKRGRASTRQIEKTEQYWDRRKKNNVSAKKSRDARRQRETLMNQRSAMLETENLRLRAELATLRDENTRLKQEVDSLKKIRS